MRTGRPKLDDNARKRNPLSIRFTEEERKKIDAAAKLENKKPSDWARQKLLLATKADQ